MSIRAIAYVKPLVGLSLREKMLLFVLADYHNTRSDASWPSIPLLARESLMSEREAYKVIGQLERKGIIERLSTPGRGNAYRFPSIDEPDSTEANPCSMYAGAGAVRKL